MLAGGIVLIVLGLVLGALGLGGGALGFGLGFAAGGSLVGIGVLVAVGGAIVKAIEEQTATLAALQRGQADDYRKGVESLWGQLDRIRANTAPSLPSSGATDAVNSPRFDRRG